MKSVLNQTVNPGNITIGNIAQNVAIRNSTNDFVWSYNTNNIVDTYKAVDLTLENGNFQFYCNDWDLYTIGNTEVNINATQAIQIAKEQALKTYPFATNNITILDNESMATLNMQNRGNFTLYPHWEILLPLDTAYGAVTCIQVLLWADTGQIDYMAAVGNGGITPSVSDSPSVLPTTLQEQSSTSNQAWIIFGMLIAVVLVVASYLSYRRRR